VVYVAAGSTDSSADYRAFLSTEQCTTACTYRGTNTDALHSLARRIFTIAIPPAGAIVLVIGLTLEVSVVLVRADVATIPILVIVDGVAVAIVATVATVATVPILVVVG